MFWEISNRLQPHTCSVPILFFLSNCLTWDLFLRTHLFGNEFTAQDFALPPGSFFPVLRCYFLAGEPSKPVCVRKRLLGSNVEPMTPTLTNHDWSYWKAHEAKQQQQQQQHFIYGRCPPIAARPSRIARLAFYESLCKGQFGRWYQVGGLSGDWYLSFGTKHLVCNVELQQRGWSLYFGFKMWIFCRMHCTKQFFSPTCSGT